METQQQQLTRQHTNWDRALDDYATRRHLAQSMIGFCLVYLPHYFFLEPAEFHPELIKHLSDPAVRLLLVEGFRGSAKSVMGSLALPLWASLEKHELYPFIIPVADTGLQASVNIANIKTELDNNTLLKQDYGAITGEMVEDWTLESEEEWQAKNMLLSNGVRILARSRGQKVRGLRHREHRPKLVIVDDPEDLEWVRTKEKRDKTEKWLRGEVLPAVDERTGKVVVIGNRLHTDALIARLGRDPMFKRLSYPLLKDGTGEEFERCTWKGKYPTQQAIDTQKSMAGATGWSREYLLKVVPDEGQEVTEADIHYYDDEPVETTVGLQATAFDLAISKKQTADYTAGVEGHTAIIDDHFKIFIQPDPLNVRFDMHELIEFMKGRQQVTGGLHLFYVENVAYQKAAIDEMIRELLPVEAVPPIGDKRARLKIAAKYIKNGTVLFPRTGCEDLLIQLLGFGVEDHDDLVDALVYLILELVKQGGRGFAAIAL